MNQSPGLLLDASQIESVIKGGLPAAGSFAVEEVRPNYARIRLPFHARMLRPGNIISGPALFAAADTAMYALVMAHIGPVVMAVTTDMNLRFINAGPAGDIVAEATMLRLGLRSAVMEVALYTGPDRTFAAHATGTYALPRRRATQEKSS